MDKMSEAIEAFDEFVNDLHTWPTIMGQEFAPADILKDVDPIAYRGGFHDWADAAGINPDDLEDDADLP